VEQLKAKHPDLLIDSNERGKLCEAVIRHGTKMGLTIARRELLVGDYLLGNACVESKSIADLFQSSHNGHIWRQLENMDANYERFFLLIHGTVKDYIAQVNNRGGKRLTYTKIQNQLTGTIARIMADFDCQVYRALNHSEGSVFICRLHDKLHKPASRHGAKVINKVSTNDVRKDVLLSIPGVGMQLAERLLESCGSLEEMCHEQSLREVKGLGKTLKNRIIETLTSEEEVSIKRRVVQT
jgi:ERCC4-type nuclease